MKKLFFTCIFCFALSYNATAQESEATAKETANWVLEKIQKYLKPDNNKIKIGQITVSACSISIFVDFGDVYNGNGKMYLYEIPTYKLSVYPGGFSTNVASIKRKNFSENSENFVSNTCCFFDLQEGEENLFERLEKAIKHLNTFCPKKKETF